MLEDYGKHTVQSEKSGFFRITGRNSENPFKKNSFHNNFRNYLDRCAELLVDRAGKNRVKGILLSGSFSLGEGSISFDSGSPTLLSDIDLLVVVESLDIHYRLLKIKQELSEACEMLFLKTSFMGHIDIGVVMLEEFKSFPRSPGSYDMRRYGVVLFGNPFIPKLLPDFGSDGISGREGVRLLENRIASLLGAYPSKEISSVNEQYRFLYQIAKAYMDILTAGLCVAGCYVPGYEKRWEFLNKSGIRELPEGLITGKIVKKAKRWLDFKLDPSLERIGIPEKDYDEIWFEAAGDVMKCWKRYEAYLQAGDYRSSDLSEASSLLKARRTKRWKRDNLRAWKGYLSQCPPGRRLSIILPRIISMPFKPPVEIVRAEGVRLLDHAVAAGPGGDAQVLPCGFSYGKVAWKEAALELNRQWQMLVSGRRG